MGNPPASCATSADPVAYASLAGRVDLGLTPSGWLGGEQLLRRDGLFRWRRRSSGPRAEDAVLGSRACSSSQERALPIRAFTRSDHAWSRRSKPSDRQGCHGEGSLPWVRAEEVVSIQIAIEVQRNSDTVAVIRSQVIAYLECLHA